MNKPLNKVVLMMGGNIGDTHFFLSKAIEMITNSIGPIEIVSSVYSSAAWGYSNQSDFLNQAAVLTTGLSPFEVLEATQNIEITLFKNTPHMNGPRTIDIDILFYNDLIINKSGLKIPHPRLHVRRFNLEPLDEIMPAFIHPVLKENISSLLQKCEDPLSVIKLHRN